MNEIPFKRNSIKFDGEALIVYTVKYVEIDHTYFKTYVLWKPNKFVDWFMKNNKQYERVILHSRWAFTEDEVERNHEKIITGIENGDFVLQDNRLKLKCFM